MSNSSLTSAVVTATTALSDLTRQERPAAAITLTRTSTLSITTSGTTITWQSQTRGQGITWSGTDITIPTAGYYLLNFDYAGSVTHTAYVRLGVNGTFVTAMASSYVGQVIASNFQAFTAMRYFATGAVLTVNIVPSVNLTVQVNAENAANESPILHIVQLTSVVT